MPGYRTVQVDQVKALSALFYPALGDRHRVIIKHGFFFHATLPKAHTAPGFNIDGGYQQHLS
jgi:hypothetical protein